jgi:hypothetical protein
VDDAIQKILDGMDDYDNDIEKKVARDIAALVGIASRAQGYADAVKEGQAILREQMQALDRRTLAILETLAASRPELIDAAAINGEAH